MRAEMLEPCAGEGEDGSRRRLRPVQLKMHVRFPEALADLPDDERQAAPTRESLQQNLPPEPAMLAPREPPPRTPIPSQDLPRPSHQVCGKPRGGACRRRAFQPVADHLPLELNHEAARRVVITVRVQEEHGRQLLERPEVALLDAYPAERIPVGFAVASDRDAEARLPRTSLGPRRVCSHRARIPCRGGRSHQLSHLSERRRTQGFEVVVRESDAEPSLQGRNELDQAERIDAQVGERVECVGGRDLGRRVHFGERRQDLRQILQRRPRRGFHYANHVSSVLLRSQESTHVGSRGPAARTSEAGRPGPARAGGGAPWRRCSRKSWPAGGAPRRSAPGGSPGYGCDGPPGRSARVAPVPPHTGRFPETRSMVSGRTSTASKAGRTATGKGCAMHVGMGVIFQGEGEGRTDRNVYRNELRLGDLAEPLGFESLWGVEHHFTDYTMCPDVLLYLTYFAGRTQRIQLGSMVVVLPWHSPLRVAAQVVMLDHMWNGRLILGLGRGLGRVEFEGFGVNQEDSRALVSEAAQMILEGLQRG